MSRRGVLVALVLALAASACSAAPEPVVAPSSSPTNHSPSPAPTPTPSPSNAVAASTPPATHPALPRRFTAGDEASVAVAVLTAWGSAGAARTVDAPALENPVRYISWLAAMTTAQRRALSPTRVNTSVLYGERILITGVKGDWLKIAVPSQKSPWDARGYPGWVPARQLSPKRVPDAQRLVTVIAKTTWLADAAGKRVLEVGYATRLPLVAEHGDRVEAWSPGPGTVFLSAADVSVHDASRPAQPKTVESVLADARRFLGLPYLWDGSSAWGFDCSGITYQVYRTHGVLLPRDSFGQVTVGRKIERRDDLLPGDLIFFATNGRVHHVGFFLGGDAMLHAPRTGKTVEIVTLAESGLDHEFAGGRRFL
ncbi:MAG TPA: C40 family peptidase [Actinomycetota bacterium]